jgi:acyl-CoA thioesterase
MRAGTVKRFFTERDLFARHCGIKLVAVGAGTARARMTVRREHFNGVATCHGGAIFTLADFAFAAACNSHGTIAVALSVNITFLTAVCAGDTLTATVEETAKKNKIGDYLVRVTNRKKELVALFNGVAFRLPDPLPVSRRPAARRKRS